MAFLGKGKKEDPLDLMRQGKYKQAIKLLEEKLKQNPHEFSLKVRLAEAYEGDKRKEDAAQIYVKEAEVRLAAGELSDAVAMLKRAVRLTPENTFLIDRLAQLERATRREDSEDEAFTFDVDTKEGTSEQGLPKVEEGAPRTEEAGAPQGEAPAIEEEQPFEMPVTEVPAVAEGAREVKQAAALAGPGPVAPVLEAPPVAEVREVPAGVDAEDDEVIEEAPLEIAPSAEAVLLAEAAPGAPPAAPPVLEKEEPAAGQGGPQPAEAEEVQLIEAPEFIDEAPEPENAVPQSLPEESPSLLEEIAEVHEDTSSLKLVGAPAASESPEPPAPGAQIGAPRPGKGTETVTPPPPQPADMTMEAPSVLLDETFSNFIALLFPDLSPEHLAAVRSVSRALKLQPDQVLVREGEEGDSLFILTRGRLEARGTFEGREITLATFTPGDILGEVAFLNMVPRTATVKALEPSVAIELQGELTRKQLASYPGLLNQLEVILQERVLKTLALLKKAEKRPDGNP